MQKLTHRLLALLVLLLLAPEVQAQQQPVRRPPLPARLQGRAPGDRALRPGEVPRRELPPTGREAEEEEAPARAAQPRNDTPADRRRAVNAGQGKFKLDFDGADITEVIRAISDMTGKNFILPDNVRGKVTILSPTAVTPDEAYAAFLAALEANNLAVYPVGKFLKVIPKKEAQRSNIPTSVDPDGFYPWNEQMVTKLFRLEHVEVDTVNNVVKGLVSRDGEVQSIPPDLLVVTDVGLNLHRIERIVNQIDQSGGADEIRIIQVRYASAPDIAETLMQIFEGQGGGSAPTPTRARSSRARRARRAAQQAQASDEGELEVEISRVIADERTNKLIVIADERSFRRIEEILSQLDVPTEGEGQVHVHYLDNANAEELANTLSQLSQGTPQAARAGRPTPARARTARNGDTPETSAELFEGELKITADKATNSLVIISSYNDYKALAKVIEKLDIPRRMVFVEAVIMEVSLDTSSQFGLSFHQGAAPELGGSGDVAPVIVGTKLGNLNSLSLAGLLSFGGFLAGIQGPPVEGTEAVGGVPSFGVVLQALQRDSRVNVLSTPHLLTADNEEAEITVGQNVPFQAGYAPSGISNLLSTGAGTNGTTNQQNINPSLLGLSSVGGLSSFFAPIQRQNVELKLKIKPQINESDLVRLVIEEQTEEIVGNDPQLGPTTARRTAKTTVVARDGRTVVIGGLIQERDIESVQKVPVLGDIPVLGWLFRSNDTKTIKTNLLLFLTPYIIKSEADFQRIFERKLEEREEFVEQFYGISGYEGEIDFGRKVGPLGQVQKSLEEARMAPENGGPGKDVQVITPSVPPPADVEVEGAPPPPTEREPERLGEPDDLGTEETPAAEEPGERQGPMPEEGSE